MPDITRNLNAIRMYHTNQRGISILAVLIIIITACLVIGGGFLLINQEKARTRDAKRMSDMTRVQAAFELMFNQTASYAMAATDGCSQTGMPVSSCALGTFLPSIGQFKDPGKYAYIVTAVPTELTYQVTFTLEKDYGTLKAGKHTLSPDGIK